MKVFKTLHPKIQDGIIVRHVGAEHGTQRTLPLSQCFANLQTPEGENIKDIINISGDVSQVDQVGPLDFLSQVSLSD